MIKSYFTLVTTPLILYDRALSIEVLLFGNIIYLGLVLYNHTICAQIL